MTSVEIGGEDTVDEMICPVDLLVDPVICDTVRGEHFMGVVSLCNAVKEFM